MRLTLESQFSVLRRLESAERSTLLFEQFSENAAGFTEITCPEWTDEEQHAIDALIARGFLGYKEVNDGPWLGMAPGDPFKESYISLTATGHDELERVRNNNWWKRALRWLGRTLDKALSSIILPIVVTILTTILLKFFNL